MLLRNFDIGSDDVRPDILQMRFDTWKSAFGNTSRDQYRSFIRIGIFWPSLAPSDYFGGSIVPSHYIKRVFFDENQQFTL
jgi:hypothetical protein